MAELDQRSFTNQQQDNNTSSETATVQSAEGSLPAEKDAASPRLELILRTPPGWSFITIIMLNLLLVFSLAFSGLAVWVGWSGKEGWWQPLLLLTLLTVGSVAFIIVAIRSRIRPAKVPPIRAHTDHLVLPRNSRSTRTRILKYEDILSINVRGKGRYANVLIGAHQRIVWYPLRAFSHSNAVDLLRAEIRKRLRDQPNGDAQIEQMDRREAIGRVAWATTPLVTYGLASMIAVVFLLEYLCGSLDDLFGLVRYGANAPALVAEGQVFRLFVANFLHVNFIHVYMNGIALLVLGMLVERLVGPWRFLLIYLVSALAGALASAMVGQAAYSVGASTAVFGVLGSFGVVNWRFRGDLPGVFRQPLWWWVFVLGLNALLPFLVPQIDIAAHVGGFAAGALLTAALCRVPESIQRKDTASALIKVASSCAALLFAIGFVQAALYAHRPDPSDELRVARKFISSRAAKPAALNAIAWKYATDAKAPPAKLEIATLAGERAAELEPNDPAILDSLATAYYRIGELDLAISTQRRAIHLAKKDRRFYYLQLARFLARRLDEKGPFERGDGANATRIRVRVEPRDPAGTAKRALRLDVDARYQWGAVVMALAKRENEVLGMLVFRFGPNGDRRNYRFVLDLKTHVDRWGDDVSFDVALVDTYGCLSCTEGSMQWWYVNMDADVKQLP